MSRQKEEPKCQKQKSCPRECRWSGDCFVWLMTGDMHQGTGWIPCRDFEVEEPEAGEFTKRVRTEPYNPKWKHTVIIRTEDRDKLCDTIDCQADKLKKLLGDLDAECRVSQMLLASQKKIKGHLEQALLYTDPPHPAAKERIKEAREYLDSLK